jgi:Pup amidohydrolase
MSRRAAVPRTVPKLCGADVELGNFIAGVERPAGTGAVASRALLRALATITPVARDEHRTGAFDPSDWARMHLPANGGCAYIDLDHLELCLPEVLSAHDHVAAWHAMLRLAQAALAAANQQLPEGRRIQAVVNNSDGRGNSFGSHLNLLVTRAAWDNVIERKLHYLAYLAAFQASSLVYTGQGKVGSENGTPPARYQLSQRADFIETLIGPQTTFRRPLVNSRDEPLCGRSDSLARMHMISFDSTLCHGASLLRVGVAQLILAMLEAGAVTLALALDDPLAAFHAWSRDPLLEARAPLLDGRKVTAVELQLRLLEDARRFDARDGFAGLVPGAEEILSLWEDTLARLARGDWNGLARRLDWTLKLAMLERALHQRPELDWEAPELKYLDHLYAGLDPDEGLYWAWSRAGLVDTIVPEGSIARFCEEPPADTRAWGRAMLLREGADAIDRVDWDFVRFRLTDEQGHAAYRLVGLPDPLGATRADLESAFLLNGSLEELLDAVGASPVPTPPEYLRAWHYHAPPLGPRSKGSGLYTGRRSGQREKGNEDNE